MKTNFLSHSVSAQPHALGLPYAMLALATAHSSMPPALSGCSTPASMPQCFWLLLKGGLTVLSSHAMNSLAFGALVPIQYALWKVASRYDCAGAMLAGACWLDALGDALEA